MAQMTIQEGIAKREAANEALLSILNDVHVTKGVLGFSKSVGCSGCADRVEVSYPGLNDEPDTFEVWEVQGEVQVLCLDCVSKFATDPVMGRVRELSLIEYTDLEGEEHKSLVAPETADAVVRKFRSYQDEGEDVRSPRVVHNYAQKVRHFGKFKAMRAGGGK